MTQLELKTPEQMRLATVVRDTRVNREVRRQALADLLHLTQAPAPVVRAPVAPEPRGVDDHWSWLATYRLQIAAVENDQTRVQELVAAFREKGLVVPDYRGAAPQPEPPQPEREPLPYPDFDQRGAALHTYRVQPKGSRVVAWGDWNDEW